MRAISFAPFANLILSSCETDLRGTGDLRPTETGFEATLRANNFQKPDDPDAEAFRREVLARRVADNAICSSGYRITDRTPIFIAGALYDIRYTALCL